MQQLQVVCVKSSGIDQSPRKLLISVHDYRVLRTADREVSMQELIRLGVLQYPSWPASDIARHLAARGGHPAHRL